MKERRKAEMINVDGATKVLGVIGNPVEHTKSPLIHNELAKRFGHNLVYVPFLVKEQIGDAIQGADALGIHGLNVTIPYKEDILSKAKEVDSLTAKIGAGNTLVRIEQGFKAYNTDIPGLLRAMKSDGVEIKGESVIIIGAGGAARAVALMVAMEEAKEIIICNRTMEKAENIAKEVNAYVNDKVAKACSYNNILNLEGSQYLAIQATSVGLSPDIDRSPIEDEAFFDKIHTAYDIIYNPDNTKFMQMATAKGKKSYNGLKMLLYQGIIAYELWNQVEITEEIANEIYGILKVSCE